MADIDVLLCYRGRYHNEVERLDAILASRGLRITYDSKILAAETPYEETEIEWLSLGMPGGEESVAWRGPLSQAVKRCELLVFLVNPHDPSVNVMNEIAWAGRAGKPLFAVFDGMDGASEDFEGINMGMLQAFYAMSADNPEMQAFGYAFVAHGGDEGLHDRLTILANRIVSYLEHTRRGTVAKINLEEHTTLADVENAPPARARRRLREAQEKLSRAIGIQEPPNASDTLQETLARLYVRERDGVVRDGLVYPRNSPFSYPEASERERYRRAEALVNRIRPGQWEMPDYLVMLARELVSVQMTTPLLPEVIVLVGSVYRCPSNLPVDAILGPGFVVLLVDATYLDFAYQMLKAAVMCWKITSPAGRLPVSMSTKLDDIRATISGSPAVVAGFASSLDRMLREGLPGSSTEGAPAAAYHPALSILGVFGKRFSLAAALARVALMVEKRKERGEEHSKPTPAEWITMADLLAAHWVFESAQKLDRTDATVALQSILLWLASEELIERSMPGFAAPEIVPARVRMAQISEYYQVYAIRSGMPAEEAKQRRRGSREISSTLEMLWNEATRSGRLDLTTLEPAARWRRGRQSAAGGA